MKRKEKFYQFDFDSDSATRYSNIQGYNGAEIEEIVKLVRKGIENFSDQEGARVLYHVTSRQANTLDRMNEPGK